MIDFLLLLKLFWTFFKIGLFTFGGGYAMIPLMQSEVVGQNWLDYDTMINFLAISESTPGPFAINMATFIGENQAGLLGALVTTTGIILPSFIIITIIAAVSGKFIQTRFVQAGLKGIRPIIIGLILSAGTLLVLHNLVDQYPLKGPFRLDMLILTINLAIIYFGYWIWKKRQLSPITFVIISAIFGLIIFI